MEKKELEDALKAHGDQIQAKQAELQKAVEAKFEEKAALLQKEIDEAKAAK